MDQYPYLGSLYCLTSIYLCAIRQFALLIAYPQKHNQVNAYQGFGAVAGDFLFIRGVYANINTKYFIGTSDICFDLLFLILYFFFVL